MPASKETTALLKLIEKLTEKVEELSSSVREIKEERASRPVITSMLTEEERRKEALSSPGMQKALDKVLLDWEKIKGRG